MEGRDSLKEHWDWKESLERWRNRIKEAKRKAVEKESRREKRSNMGGRQKNGESWRSASTLKSNSVASAQWWSWSKWSSNVWYRYFGLPRCWQRLPCQAEKRPRSQFQVRLQWWYKVASTEDSYRSTKTSLMTSEISEYFTNNINNILNF